MTDPPLELAEIFIDESSHTNHKYLVLGGIVSELREARQAENEITLTRLPELPSGIMKWTKVSRAKLPAYTRVVDKFFELRAAGVLHFHSVVVDTHKQNHKLYNQGSQEIGFNKEVYQLAMKFGRLYREYLFHVYPDRRTTNQSPADLRLMLNRGIAGSHNDKRDWPYRRLQFREPEDSQLLQLADVFAGAIAWKLNGHDQRPDASPAKTTLSDYILRKAQIRNPFMDTLMRDTFSIWHRQLR